MTVRHQESNSATVPEPAEPIAVVGMSCRLPGATDPDAFWRHLADGVSTVGDLPAGRPDTGFDAFPAGPPYTVGGFLDEVDTFDAGFFGISDDEADAMDPQQRLLLELSWEALEDARIVPDTLRGTPTGVFTGVMAGDYAALLQRLGPADGREPGPYTLTGLAHGIAANRVSYVLGLGGPSLTVDSAQSSALTAVHLACASLRSGESDTALAGGVSLVLDPYGTEAVDRLGALSPDGRCHTFDARANGYVRGEGGGVVVLKLLSRALADGDRPHAVILGSAVNSDGATPGLTSPDPRAQQDVIGRAVRQAGLYPADVQYVELHGTGTRAGDPAEAAALGAALGGELRPAGSPLVVGSAKTNIGHLEGASGIAGLLKVILSLGHRTLPASLHHVTPNPRARLDDHRLRVQQVTGPWPRPDRRLIAGVSSFGMGGSNAHVVVAESPVPAGTRPAAGTSGTAEEHGTGAPGGRDATAPLPGGPLVWPLSARDSAALGGQAARLLDALATRPGRDPRAVGSALARTRTAFAHRAVAVAEDAEGLLVRLDALRDGLPAAGLVTGVAREVGRTVFVFPGQGSQWAGMALQLRDTSSVFARRFDACAAALAPHIDWEPADVLGDEAALGRVDVVQPALWAVMVSLAALWESHGVRPDAVIGHSQGEIAAAVVSGALSIEDGAAVVALRSRAIADLAGSGAMASVPLPAAEVRAEVALRDAALCVAAVNGPRSTVVSGPPGAVEDLVRHYQDQDVRARLVPVDYASHSPAMEALRERLLGDLRDIAPRGSGRVAFYSSLTGGRFEPAQLDADYWYRSLREPVAFDRAMRAVLADGHRTVVESSPHPILAPGVEQIAEQLAERAAADGDPVRLPAPVVTGTLRRGDGDLRQFLLSAAALYVAGVPVRLTDDRIEPVDLPTYAFQRRRHWLPATPQARQRRSVPEPANTVLPRTTAAGAGPVQPSGPRAVWQERLASRPVADQHRQLLDLVRGIAAAVLGSPGIDSVPAERGFLESKIDSLAAVEVRNRLNAALGLNLPSSSVFDYATPAALGAYLHELLAPAAPATPVAEVPAELDDEITTDELTDEELFALIDDGIGRV
ncbi:type I polyketide synthase [Streptomyces sp. NPDC049040]|uniref:type I polyketide synthase n=1 Tax=Streptomyces sp. NPDC049040 TaxID=3365593 RepID=UPI00371AC600